MRSFHRSFIDPHCARSCAALTILCAGASCSSASTASDSSSADPYADGGAPAAHEDGGGGDNDAATGTMPVSSVFPAPFPAPPQVVSLGGPVLASPKIVAVFFSNEDPTDLPSIEQYYKGIGASHFWQALSEYGVGSATAQIVPLDEAAPSSIDDTETVSGAYSALENWLHGEINSGALPNPDANTVYVINYPATTTITSDGNTLCQGQLGYHSDTSLSSGGSPIAYAVVGRCPASYGLSPLDLFTSYASHELAEASTDPYIDRDPAWKNVDDDHVLWQQLGGGEIADLCVNQGTPWLKYSDFPFMVQRFWSNAAAAAGRDSCAPEYAGEHFFNAAPELTDTATVDYQGQIVTTKIAHIETNASATILLDLYSTENEGPWTVSVTDLYALETGDLTTALLTFSMPQTTGTNGSKIPLTITVNGKGNASLNGQPDSTEFFRITSTQGSGDSAVQYQWWGAVAN